MKINATCLVLGLFILGAPVFASDVRIVKTNGGWQLRVDDQPFVIKGVGCNTAKGSKGEDYLQMAQEMGANAVRTWGDTTVDYLDRAQQLGLKVAVGFWLNAVRKETPESYRDPARCRDLKEKILADIRRMKSHPAVLCWGVGTEVFSHTPDPGEKKAFAAFYTDLIDSIHREDPHHPIFYGTADEMDLPDLVQYAPNIDIVGIDTYGAIHQAMGWLERHGFEKPTLLAEFGPHGSWDVPKDKNNYPFDPSDALKAADYEETWNHMLVYGGRCLGGFAFVLGESRNQDSVTWNNLNDDAFRRISYWRMYSLYTGHKPPRPIPQISEFLVDSGDGVRAGCRFNVKTVASISDGSPLDYHFSIARIFTDPLIVYPVTYIPSDPTVLSLGSASLRAPDEPGVYRVYARVTDSYGNIAIANRSLKVLPEP